jgi:hypothetical protein
MQNVEAASPKRSVTWLYGVAAGVALSLCSTFFYKQGAAVFVSNLSYIRWLLLIAFGIASALHAKQRNGGWIGLQAATKACFLVFVIGFAIETLFTWFLLNTLDPKFKLEVSQAALTRAMNFYRNYGMSESDTEKALDMQRGTDQFTLGKMIMGLALFYILFFIFALIIAVIVKKKPKTGTAAGGL